MGCKASPLGAVRFVATGLAQNGCSQDRSRPAKAMTAADREFDSLLWQVSLSKRDIHKNGHLKMAKVITCHQCLVMPQTRIWRFPKWLNIQRRFLNQRDRKCLKRRGRGGGLVFGEQVRLQRWRAFHLAKRVAGGRLGFFRLMLYLGNRQFSQLHL